MKESDRKEERKGVWEKDVEREKEVRRKEREGGGSAKREKNKGNWEKKVRTTKRWEKVKKMKER